jgi:cell division protein FtsW (lipid II flippase)
VRAPSLRWREAGLLVPAMGLGLAASGAVSLGLHGRLEPSAMAGALALAALAAGVHLALSAAGSRADEMLLPLVTCLAGLGLAESQRLAPALAARQAVWLAVGMVALGGAALLPYRLALIRRYRYSIGVAGIALVALTLVAGSSPTPGGPPLWIRMGPFSFQPAEALKLLIVLFLAAYLDDKQEVLASASTRLGPLRLPPLPYLAPLAAMLGLSLALLAVQGDLGAALLLFLIGLAMLFLASGRASYVVGSLLLFGAGAWLLLWRLPVVQTRVAIWLDPWADAHGAGYQLVQSLMALAAGGATGTGLARGLPTAIPAVHTDFVYAAVAEELGLAGAAAVVVLYLLLAHRGFRVALAARSTFGAILAAGLTVALTVQSLIIIAGVVRLVPLTGITLPFLSQGGSSVLASSLAVGLLLHVDGGSGQ